MMSHGQLIDENSPHFIGELTLNLVDKGANYENFIMTKWITPLKSNIKGIEDTDKNVEDASRW